MQTTWQSYVSIWDIFFYDVDSKIVIYPNTGSIGFVVETF